jgi:hypothetical protein
MLLFAKHSSIDRGIDNEENITQNIIVGSEPYVPPEVDLKIKEEIDNLQQVVFPVQYIDNGILNEIPQKTTKITQVLQGEDYNGPIPHSSGDAGASLEHLNRMPPLNISTTVIPEFESDNDIVPYNSIDNIIASSQNIQEYESESV